MRYLAENAFSWSFWNRSWKIYGSSHISPSSVAHHTGFLLYQQIRWNFLQWKSLSVRALKRILLCSGFLITFIGARHETFLTRQKFTGNFLQNLRTRFNTSCLHRPLNFLFLSAEICAFSKRFLVAASKSTNSSSKWCFVLVSHSFNLFIGVSDLSRASFRNIRRWLRIISNSSVINGTMGFA